MEASLNGKVWKSPQYPASHSLSNEKLLGHRNCNSNK